MAHSGKNNPFKPVWVLFALLVIFTGATALLKYGLEREDKIPWRTNITVATNEAKHDGKPVLLYFTATWCGPCQKLKSETWGDKEVEAKLRGYVPVKLDIDENKEIAQRYGIEAIPAFIRLDKDFKIISQTDGFMPASEFLKWLNTAG